jgi:hypothetical protein
LRHILIEHFEGRRVGRIPVAAGHFVILDSPQLVILLPGIGLDDLRGGKKSQNRRVSLPEFSALLFGVLPKGLSGDQKLTADGRPRDRCHSPLQYLRPRRRRV